MVYGGNAPCFNSNLTSRFILIFIKQESRESVTFFLDIKTSIKQNFME